MRVLLSWVGQRDPRWGEAFYHEGPVLTFLNEYLAEGYPPFDHIALFFTPGDAPVPGASDKLSFGQRADRLRQEIGSRQAHAPSATASSAVETYMVELDEPHLFVAVQATLPPRVRHVLETLRRECAVRTLIADASIVLGLAGARGSRGTRLVDAIAAATTRLEQSPKDEEARDRLNSLLNAWYRRFERVRADQARKLRRRAAEPLEVHVLTSPGTTAQAWGWLHCVFSGVIGSAFDVDPGGTDEPPWGPVLWQVRDPTRSSDGPLIRPLRLDQIVRPLRAHWLDRRKAALQMRIQAAREALAKEGYDPNSAPPVLPHGLDEEELVRAVGWTAYLTAKASFSTTVAIGNALSLPESVVRDRYLTGRARPRNLPQETPGALAQLCTDLAEAPRAPEDWL